MLQGIQQGIPDLDSAGIHCIFAGSLVIDDDDLLFGIRFPFQIQRLAHHRAETLQTVRNDPELLKPARIRIKRRKHKRHRAAVQLRHRHALTQHASGHPPLVFQILMIRLADLDRAEQRNVIFFQSRDRRVGIVHREPSVRLVNNQIRLDLLQHGKAAHHAGDADHVDIALFQSRNQCLEISSAVAGENADRRVFPVISAGFLIEFQVFGIGREDRILIGMEKCGGRNMFRRKRFFREQTPAVNRIARIIHQLPEILLAAVPHIGGYILRLRLRQSIETRLGTR